MTEVFYRYVDSRVALPADEWGDSRGSEPCLRLREYEVLKHTPKGTWINEGWGKNGRFVLRDARKKFAHPTILEAKESFLARKRRQMSILKARQKHIEDVVAILLEKESLFA